MWDAASSKNCDKLTQKGRRGPRSRMPGSTGAGK